MVFLYFLSATFIDYYINKNFCMMHSKKYNYYKLPGGGIEPEETLEDTLIREVREESGLIVKAETIKF